MLRLAQKGPLGSRLWAVRLYSVPSRATELVSETTEISGDQEYESRRVHIQTQSPANFYPLYSSIVREDATTLRIPQFVAKYQYIKPTEKVSNTCVCIEGRITAIRRMSKSLVFVDVVQDGVAVQIVLPRKEMGLDVADFDAEIAKYAKGDHISAQGQPARTKSGELSVRASTNLSILAPCVLQPAHRLEQREKINANRVLNYLVNPKSRNYIVTKAKVISAIRNYLTSDGFLEVQTPILAGDGTGANAQPFESKCLSLDKKVSLRVAPELWLKKLVISGFDKVFEIGQNFRNEGIDATHNPEFTSCEFYKLHINLEGLMTMTEEIVHAMLKEVGAHGQDIAVENQMRLALARTDYRRVEFIPAIEEITGFKLPEDLSSSALIDYFQKVDVPLPLQRSPAHLLDTLAGVYLEPLLQKEPVFIYNHPAVMSPLAKLGPVEYNGRVYEISRRFELFIAEQEYANSYEEENSPFEQLSKFNAQLEARDEFRDAELLVPDWAYVKAMEYGLPPTGGWGCGIDRFAMLFGGTKRIEDVLTFGTLKDVVKQ